MRLLRASGGFICDKCGLNCPSRDTFQKHLKWHRSERRICDLCAKSFNKRILILQHMKKVHLKLRSFDCTVCKLRTFNEGNLKNHMLQHKSKTECKICHKFVANMKAHLRCHVKVKCSICSKTLSKNSLLMHLKRVHDNEKSKWKLLKSINFKYLFWAILINSLTS